MRFLCISYGADVGHLFRRSAHYIDNILKGTKPSDLPVQQVTTVELLFWIDQIVVLSWLVPAGLALVYSAPSPPGPRGIRRPRLAVSVWSLAQGSIFAAPLAPICGDARSRGGRWPRALVLRVAVWVRMVCGCGSYHHRKPPVCCTEVATLRAIDKVSPGPDLDALIAEDVFGWGNVSPRLKSQSRR